MNQQSDIHSRLGDPEEAQRFYEARYQDGYMETWPAWKLERVRELISRLPLPETGEALDFGCGNGVFTRVLVDALPGWSIFGTDISKTALANAQASVSGASFFCLDETREYSNRFDFVFTHHVLEHVAELDDALEEIDGLLKGQSAVFHILPCGNPGSFEHNLCLLRAGGIDAGKGGRFYFEDVGHVRRLRSDDLVSRYTTRGFSLVRESYACQEAGAIEWITAAGTGFVARLTDPDAAVDASAKQRLRSLRRKLLPVAFVREVKRQFEYRIRQGNLRAVTYLKLFMALPICLVGWFVERSVLAASRREWVTRNRESGGSEMYLFFVRKDTRP